MARAWAWGPGEFGERGEGCDAISVSDIRHWRARACDCTFCELEDRLLRAGEEPGRAVLDGVPGHKNVDVVRSACGTGRRWSATRGADSERSEARIETRSRTRESAAVSQEEGGLAFAHWLLLGAEAHQGLRVRKGVWATAIGSIGRAGTTPRARVTPSRVPDPAPTGDRQKQTQKKRRAGKRRRTHLVARPAGGRGSA